MRLAFMGYVYCKGMKVEFIRCVYCNVIGIAFRGYGFL